MRLPVEKVTGSIRTDLSKVPAQKLTRTITVAKRKCKCRVCGDFINKGESRVTLKGYTQEWIGGAFREVFTVRHEHVNH